MSKGRVASNVAAKMLTFDFLKLTTYLEIIIEEDRVLMKVLLEAALWPLKIVVSTTGQEETKKDTWDKYKLLESVIESIQN